MLIISLFFYFVCFQHPVTYFEPRSRSDQCYTVYQKYTFNLKMFTGPKKKVKTVIYDFGHTGGIYSLIILNTLFQGEL